MSERSSDKILEDASAWWTTAIVDIHPGQINIRGYPIQDLIGELRFSEMVWLMLRGDLPSPEQASLLEAALVAAVDHGPQAPSIAIARMAVTCGLPVNGAMSSAINALDDVHGGAGQQCMSLLQDIVVAMHATGSTVTRNVVDAALDDFISRSGEIVPGFGHRFHPIDPRAVKLLAMVARARERGVVTGQYADIAACIEESLADRKKKPIPMNIDGATAVIHSELGFPPPLGRGLFILSRSVGILAHAWEQTKEGGRIKGPMPTSISYRYIGTPRRPFVPRRREESAL
jgi:citrate synthase